VRHGGSPCRPAVPDFRRRQARLLIERLRQKSPLIQVIRGPRQVGKTTCTLQLVAALLADGVKPTDILVRRSMELHRCGRGLLVTRDTSGLDDERLLVVPLRDFLLAY
jgi:predicted AAA+ superfamily ATPase